MRKRLLLGGVVAACALVAGCGPEIPNDASTKDFCKVSGTFAAANEFSAGVKAAKKLHDTGTPKGIPAGARKGFELVVALVADAKDESDLEKRYAALTSGEKKSIDTLDTYISKTC